MDLGEIEEVKRVSILMCQPHPDMPLPISQELSTLVYLSDLSVSIGDLFQHKLGPRERCSRSKKAMLLLLCLKLKLLYKTKQISYFFYIYFVKTQAQQREKLMMDKLILSDKINSFLVEYHIITAYHYLFYRMC